MSVIAGIDIGKDAVHVCAAADGPARSWPVQALDLRSPEWHKQLVALVPPGSTVALEPTGWYYSRPIVAVLEAAGCTVLQVAHHASKAARADRISAQKTDANDARALALKALDWTRKDATGVKATGPSADLAIELRLAMNDFLRAKQLRSRAVNRLDAYARGIWPSLSEKRDMYLRAVQCGFITPDELHTLADVLRRWPLVTDPTIRRLYRHGLARNYFIALAESLPTGLHVPDRLRSAIADGLQRMLAADAELSAADADLSAIIQRPELAVVTAAWESVPFAFPSALAALHAATNCRAQDFTADAFRAAVGCHPTRQESGQIQEAKDSKRGYRPAKAALHLWTLRLLQKDVPDDNPVKDYFQRLKDRNNPHAIHAARGKLARILSGIARAACRAIDCAND